MSTHNLCFGAKIRTCKPQFYYIKVGFKGVHIARTCYPDEYTYLFLNFAENTLKLLSSDYLTIVITIYDVLWSKLYIYGWGARYTTPYSEPKKWKNFFLQKTQKNSILQIF